MTNEFLVLTKEKVNERIAHGISACENDLVSYAVEIANHTAALATIGSLSWDDGNMKYRWMKRDDMIRDAMNAGLSSEEMQKIADLIAIDFHNGGIIAANIELGKTKRNYSNYLNTLPAGVERDAAIATVIQSQMKK